MRWIGILSLRTRIILFAPVILLVSSSFASAQKYCQPTDQPLRVVDTQGRYGYIDRKGAVILAPEQLPERVVFAQEFSEEVAPLAVNTPADAHAGFLSGTSKFGFIDATGKFVIKPQFDLASGFCDGLAFVAKGTFEGYINRAGTVVIDLNTDCNEVPLKEPKLSRCPRRTSGYEFVDEKSEGLTAVIDWRLGPLSRYGFVDGRGRMVIKAKFEPDIENHGFNRRLSKFVGGRAKVKLEGRYGFIDRRGTLVVPAKFAMVNDFSDGLAYVMMTDGSFGYIDKNGRWVIKPNGWQSGRDFEDGLAPIAIRPDPSAGLLWGYIDRRGRIAIEPRFDGAQGFKNGVASVYEVGNNGVWESRFGYIDRKGAYLWKPNSDFPVRLDKGAKGNR